MVYFSLFLRDSENIISIVVGSLPRFTFFHYHCVRAISSHILLRLNFFRSFIIYYKFRRIYKENWHLFVQSPQELHFTDWLNQCERLKHCSQTPSNHLCFIFHLWKKATCRNFSYLNESKRIFHLWKYSVSFAKFLWQTTGLNQVPTASRLNFWSEEILSKSLKLSF